jgi:hypothetical protein
MSNGKMMNDESSIQLTSINKKRIKAHDGKL